MIRLTVFALALCVIFETSLGFPQSMDTSATSVEATEPPVQTDNVSDPSLSNMLQRNETGDREPLPVSRTSVEEGIRLSSSNGSFHESTNNQAVPVHTSGGRVRARLRYLPFSEAENLSYIPSESHNVPQILLIRGGDDDGGKQSRRYENIPKDDRISIRPSEHIISSAFVVEVPSDSSKAWDGPGPEVLQLIAMATPLRGGHLSHPGVQTADQNDTLSENFQKGNEMADSVHHSYLSSIYNDLARQNATVQESPHIFDSLPVIPSGQAEGEGPDIWLIDEDHLPDFLATLGIAPSDSPVDAFDITRDQEGSTLPSSFSEDPEVIVYESRTGHHHNAERVFGLNEIPTEGSGVPLQSGRANSEPQIPFEANDLRSLSGDGDYEINLLNGSSSYPTMFDRLPSPYLFTAHDIGSDVTSTNDSSKGSFGSEGGNNGHRDIEVVSRHGFGDGSSEVFPDIRSTVSGETTEHGISETHDPRTFDYWYLMNETIKENNATTGDLEPPKIHIAMPSSNGKLLDEARSGFEAYGQEDKPYRNFEENAVLQNTSTNDVASPDHLVTRSGFYPVQFKRIMKPYIFGYDQVDESGTMQHRKEMIDEEGQVSGNYGYRDASGVYREVNYVADGKGFRAFVKTNEPGTKNSSSADVIVMAEDPPLAVRMGMTKSRSNESKLVEEVQPDDLHEVPWYSPGYDGR